MPSNHEFTEAELESVRKRFPKHEEEFTPEELEAIQKKHSRNKFKDKSDELSKKMNLNPEHSQSLEQIETANRSRLEGLTPGGISEPVISEINAVIGNMIDAGYDAEGIQDFFEKVKDPKRIEEHFEKDVARRHSLKDKHESIHNVNQVAGGIGSALAVGGAGTGKLANTALGKAGLGIAKSGAEVSRTLGKMGGQVVDSLPGAAQALKAKGLGGSLARAGKAGVIGASVAGGDAAIRLTSQGKDVKDADEKALGSAAIGAGLNMLPNAYRGVKKAGKATLASWGQVRPAAIDHYLENHEAVNKAPSVADAKQQFEELVRNLKAKITGQKSQLVETKNDALEHLENQVTKGSSESYDIAKAARGSMDVNPIKKEINKQIKWLETKEGEGTLSTSSTKAISELVNIREMLDAFSEKLPGGGAGKQVSFEQTKRIIQDVRDNYDMGKETGKIREKGLVAIGKVLTFVDQRLKTQIVDTNPQQTLHGMGPYEEKMLDVARDTNLLKEATKRLGNDDAFYNKIPDLNEENYGSAFRTLQRLERSTGKNMSYALDQIQKRTPIMALEPKGTERFLKTIFNKSSQENTKTLQMMSAMTGRDLEAWAANIANKNAFTKEFEPGSRNVNLWGLMTAAVASIGGAAAGHEFGIPAVIGGGIGAALGSYVKYYGGMVTKSLLDTYIKVGSFPTIRSIDKYAENLPPELKLRLKNDLITLVSRPSEGQITIPAEQYKQVLLNIDGATNLDTIKKAKAVDSLNRNHTVSSEDLRLIMLDDGIGGTIEQPEYDDSFENPNGLALEDVAGNIRGQ